MHQWDYSHAQNPFQTYLAFIKRFHMSFVKIMVHAVWGTKYRSDILTDDIREQVCDHIRANAKTKNIFIDSIDGYTDHLHCLTELNPELSISKQMQLIKGESSHWINQNLGLPVQFSWAEDYYAVAVDKDAVGAVRAYIKNQKEHHKKMGFQEELEEIKKEFGLGTPPSESGPLP